METIILIAITLGTAFVFSEISYRLKYPRIIGQIFVGIFFSIPPIKAYLFNGVIPEVFLFLSDFGIIFLLMLVGLEINLQRLKKSAGDSINIALFEITLSFLFGFLLIKMLGYSSFVAVIVGVCFALSAEATTLNVLIETATLNTRIGTLLLSVGIIDDLFGVMFLASILTLIHKKSINLVLSPFIIFIFIFFTYLIFKYIPRIMQIIEREKSKVSLFSSVIVIGISVAALSQFLGFGPVIGAFLSGLLLRWAIKNKHVEEENVEELKIMTFSFIIPFFFINIGLHFDFAPIIHNPLLTLLIVMVASMGKIIGVILVSFFRKISYKQALLIGWGLNSRGAIELIIIEIARQNNLIPSELYSSIVVMAVVTTLIFPFVLRYYLNKSPGIMND